MYLSASTEIQILIKLSIARLCDRKNNFKNPVAVTRAPNHSQNTSRLRDSIMFLKPRDTSFINTFHLSYHPLVGHLFPTV